MCIQLDVMTQHSLEGKRKRNPQQIRVIFTTMRKQANRLSQHFHPWKYNTSCAQLEISPAVPGNHCIKTVKM